MSANKARRTWPAHPAPSRLGYPKPADHLRILAVVRPAKGEEGLVDPWSAVWMDRGEPGSFGQVAGSTFMSNGTRCASFEPGTHLSSGELAMGSALTDRQRRLRVAWGEVPRAVQRAVCAAVREWGRSGGAKPANNTPGHDCPACGGAVVAKDYPDVGETLPAECDSCGRVFALFRPERGSLILEPTPEASP